MQKFILKPEKDIFNRIYFSDDPEREILKTYDKDGIWRNGYGYYGFRFNFKEKTITVTIGDSCD